MNRSLTRLSLLAAFVLGCAGAGAAERLSNGFTQPADAFFRAGFWWDPADPGWGLDLHMSGESLVGIWATYDGQGHPTWYLGVGSREVDAWVMPLTRYRWDGAAAVADGQAGELRLAFADGYHAQMSWTMGQDQGAAAIETFVVNETPVYADRTGFWFEPAQSGYGLSVSTQGPLLLSVFYFYDGDGQPRWAWADNGGVPGTPMELLSFRRCAECGGGLASNAVGELGLSFHSETAGSLDATLSLSDPLAGSWDTRGRAISLLTNPPSGRRTPAQLAPFTNPELLEAYMNGAQPLYPYYPGAIDFSPAPPGAEGSAPAVSETNLQEQGVDEADLIKSDGQFVFALSTGAFGARARLRVLEIDPASPNLTPLTELEVGTGQETLQGMYLVTGRPAEQPDLLVVFAGVSSYYDPWIWFSPVPWFEGNSKLFVFDISDRGQPTLTHEIEVDGAAAETRRIGERLYLVTRFIPGFIPEKGVLPGIKINGVRRELTDPSRYYLVAGDPNYPYRDVTTLSAFDLGDLDADPDSIALVGFPEALYVSLNNAFVATSRSAYRIDPQFGDLDYPYEVYTDVHQFSLAGGGVEYAGTGIVPGFLPHLGVGPSFAFSEHKGHLRVVTTSSYMFGDQDHRLTVLRLAGEYDVLPVVGFVPNDERPQPLGKPGEFLYGLRFLGNRLYAVTFKKVDPLYVIDLSEPRDPYIMGELELPGFSDYLHPLPNDLVLGFGKNTAPAEGPGDGDFAWYQGLQLSLFDVSDPTRPNLVQRVDLGRRGSSSSLLSDHHAFAYLPPDVAAGRPGRVSIPVVIHDARTPAEISPVPYHFYEWRFTGLAMFEVFGPAGEAPGLELRDVLVSHRAETDPEHDYYRDAGPLAGRGLISEDHAYFYLNGVLYASPWGQGSAVFGPF